MAWAIVSLSGKRLIRADPAAKAEATGATLAVCAQMNRGRRSVSPARRRSSKPLTMPRRLPPALTGTITQSGTRKPRSSAIS